MTIDDRARQAAEAFVRWGCVQPSHARQVEDGIYLALAAAIADELDSLRILLVGLATRLTTQSELLAKKAEKEAP